MSTEQTETARMLQLASEHPELLMTPADKLRQRIISGPAVREIPQPDWMIPGVLRKQSVAMLYGPSAVGKSFVAVELAGAVLTGDDWQGFAHDTIGPVVYLAGEGASGIAMRMDAWSAHNNHNADDVLQRFHLLPGGVPVHNPSDGGALVEVLTEIQPALVIVDTLHTHVSGESDSDDRPMGQFVATCTRIAQATGACVLFLHHTKKGELEYRGSTALFANSDTVLLLTGTTTEHGTMTTKKQKDGQLADPWTVGYAAHGTDPVTGGTLTLVSHPMARPERTVTDASVTDALLALREIATPGEAMTARQWANAVMQTYGWGSSSTEEGRGTPTTKFHNAKRQLVEQGKVVQTGKGAHTRYSLPTPPEQLTM